MSEQSREFTCTVCGKKHSGDLVLGGGPATAFQEIEENTVANSFSFKCPCKDGKSGHIKLTTSEKLIHAYMTNVKTLEECE